MVAEIENARPGLAFSSRIAREDDIPHLEVFSVMAELSRLQEANLRGIIHPAKCAGELFKAVSLQAAIVV